MAELSCDEAEQQDSRVELLENQTQLQREKLTNLLWVYFKGQVELETDNGTN